MPVHLSSSDAWIDAHSDEYRANSVWEFRQVRYDHQRAGWQSLSCRHFYQKETPRSIDTWEPGEVPVHTTPTTLLFLYLRP